MTRYVDPLTVLRANDPPVQPDPAFATRLRARLEETLPTAAGGAGTRRARSAASGPRTVKLRTVVAAAVASVLLLGFGWVWSLNQSDLSASTRDSLKAGEQSGGIVAETAPSPAAPSPPTRNARDRSGMS